MRPRSSVSNKKSKSITRNTTCHNLFDFSEIEYCCDNCKPKVDILSFKRKAKKQSNKEKHFTNRCAQPWTASYASTISKTLHHVKVCEYLKIDSTVALENECKYPKKSYSSLSSMSQTDSSSETSEKKNATKKTSKNHSNIKTSKDKHHTSSYSNKTSRSDLPPPLYNGVPQHKHALTEKQRQFELKSSYYIQPPIALPTMHQTPPPPLLLKHPAPPMHDAPPITYDEISISSDDSSIASNSNDSSTDALTNPDFSSQSTSLFVSLSKSKVAKWKRSVRHVTK